jgi:RNA polymerase sigma-70 factor (ECF subfamily)
VPSSGPLGNRYASRGEQPAGSSSVFSILNDREADRHYFVPARLAAGFAPIVVPAVVLAVLAGAALGRYKEKEQLAAGECAYLVIEVGPMPEPRYHEEFGAFRDYLMVLARTQVSVDLRCRIDPSDLVQETLCEALRDLPRHRGRTRAEMMAWLRSLLRFNLIDRLRRLRLERRVVSFDGALDQTSHGMSCLLQTSRSAPDARAAREEDALALAALLGQLSPAQAEAIVLKHCQGMSVAEISRHMNRPPDAVGGLLRHGMRRLRELMPGEG